MQCKTEILKTDFKKLEAVLSVLCFCSVLCVM